MIFKKDRDTLKSKIKVLMHLHAFDINLVSVCNMLNKTSSAPLSSAGLSGNSKFIAFALTSSYQLPAHQTADL